MAHIVGQVGRRRIGTPKLPIDGQSTLARDRSVRLENDTWDALAQLARESDLPVSWHIRRAVRRYLEAIAEDAPVHERRTTRSEAWVAEDQAAQAISPPTLGSTAAQVAFRPAPKPTPRAKPKGRGLHR